MFELGKLERLLNLSGTIFEKGREYYLGGAIQQVGIGSNEVYNMVQAKIKGSKNYTTSIIFDKDNEFHDYKCTCPFNIENNGAICKHVAALYFYIIKNKEFSRNFDFTAGKEFLDNFFANSQVENKREVNILYNVEYEPYWKNDIFGQLSLKIGLDKFYVVKNIKDFLECIKSNQNIDYGKKFSFKPSIHEFNEGDKKIIDFLSDIYFTEKLFKSESYHYQGGIFSGKNIKLDENLFIKFCRLLGDKRLDFSMEGRSLGDITVDFETSPFDIFVKHKENHVITDIKYKDDSLFFGKDDNIIYSNKKLYILNPNKKDYEFHRIARKRKVNKMEFKDEYKDMFLSIVPHILNEKNVNVSEDIVKNYVDASLESGIYIDKYKKGISIDTEFKYGEYKILPFKSESANPYIIRDYVKENEIIKLIEESEFKIKDQKVYLDDYDKIYLFFKDMMPVLSKVCNIYYTDEVKDMYMNNLKKYKNTIKIGFGGIINIDIDIEGFDKKEIANILKAIKEKKKYHKLKNGRIISLEGEGANELYTLLDRVEDNEIDDNIISLTKYRAINVFERIRDDKLNIENTEIIASIVDKIKNPDTQSIDIPDKFKGILRDYQVTGFKWLKTLSNTGLGGILADDMGLGKTLQAIALIYSEAKGDLSIVVVPSSLVYNWENEIKRFAPEIKAIVIAGDKKTREEMIEDISKYDLIITSYPLLRRDIELYEGIEFKYCIIDEAQHIKNSESINAHSVKRINAKNRFALTGTPMENSLVELWSIFDFLMPGYLLSKNKFQDKFEKPIIKDGDKNVLDDLRKVISPFILRRKKKDVLLELPDKIETKLVCELTEEQKKLYMAYIIKIKQEIAQKVKEDGFEKSRIQILTALTRLRQICCHPSVFIENYEGGSGKLELLEELIEELIEGGHRILLFSQFTSLLQIIKEVLEKKEIQYMYLDGNVPIYSRMGLVDRFNSGEGSIFLISLKAGGTGLNLTSADTVIHFDPWWNPAVEDQASDRAHRIGQENVVQVFKLITKDTIEEKIFELQGKKKELINSVIQEGETFISKLTEQELMELFKI